MARNKGLNRKTTGDYVIFIIMTILALLIVIPFYLAIVISFETPAAYARNPASLWPVEATLANYKYLITVGSLGVGYSNTLFVVVVGLIYAMLLMVSMAYAFAQPKFPGKKFFFLVVLFTMFFGGGIVPTYLLMKDLGLRNTLWGIILMGGVSGYNIIIMKGGFESVPASLREAATIDGANDLQVFWQIMLPLQLPLLATFSLFTVVGYWNSWYWPSLLINKSKLQTLQLVLRSIVNRASSAQTAGQSASGMEGEELFSMGLKMAAVVATMLPIMCVYPFLQKYFTKGVLVGSIKM